MEKTGVMFSLSAGKDVTKYNDNHEIVKIAIFSQSHPQRVAFCGPLRRDENAVRIRGNSRVAGVASLSYQSEAAPYRAGDAKDRPVGGLFMSRFTLILVLTRTRLLLPTHAVTSLLSICIIPYHESGKSRSSSHSPSPRNRVFPGMPYCFSNASITESRSGSFLIYAPG